MDKERYELTGPAIVEMVNRLINFWPRGQRQPSKIEMYLLILFAQDVATIGLMALQDKLQEIDGVEYSLSIISRALKRLAKLQFIVMSNNQYLLTEYGQRIVIRMLTNE